MKISFLILMLLPFLGMRAQPPALPVNDSGRVQFQETLHPEGPLSALQLYNNAYHWFSQPLKPVTAQLQSGDRLSYQVSGTVRFPCTQFSLIANEGYVVGNLNIRCSAGGYTYTLSQLQWQSNRNSNTWKAEDLLPGGKLSQGSKKMVQRTTEELNLQVHELLLQLKNALAKKPA